MTSPDEAGRLTPRRTPAQPPITESMRDHARRNPDSWLYVIDEAFDPAGDVPPWAIVGAYPVNSAGEIVTDFHPNDQYRPSPRALGYPEPEGELEELLQLVRTRHRRADDLPPVVLRSTLFVYAVSPRQQNLTGFYDKRGRIVVPAYTRRSLVPADWPGTRTLTGKQLLPDLAGHPLAINPGGVVTAVIPVEHLTAVSQQD
ncbi:MAG: type VII secretion system-associated protein [Actinophytocola sp.]|nr:type VII secretion system-associated protein [Actinophytocola sp.]